VHPSTLVAVALIGVAVGFLGGLFGKGGSAIATPLLAAAGIPAIAAVASPLPAVIPSTLVAARSWARNGHVDRGLVLWGTAVGIPATLAGAIATRWIGGPALVVATEVLLLGLGLRFALHPSEPEETAAPVSHPRARIVAVAAGVGVISGLLANGGGFLLAPMLVMVLHKSMKDALGTSAMLTTMLAIPGTITHAALGHIDWAVTLVFALAAIPLAGVGARVALRMRVRPLERTYGVALVAMSATFLLLAV
jgi:uncharacterized membrane protein YfcA